MKKKTIILALVIILAIALIVATVWYMKTHVHLVSKDERREIAASELGKALEHYYDEHGRYPVAATNDELMRELTAKAYFENETRLGDIRYEVIDAGRTYELH